MVFCAMPDGKPVSAFPGIAFYWERLMRFDQNGFWRLYSCSVEPAAPKTTRAPPVIE
jgi:hypothetical protein